MALKQCKECGNTVSNQAKTCPHCGARVKKSRWGIVILFALIVGVCIIILPIMRGRQIIEQEKPEVERNVKAIVEDNGRESLNEEYGIQCVSINLLEGTDGCFAGTAKLEDGREIDIDNARIDGDMIRFNRRLKEGYEHKCKHHIDQLKVNEEDGVLVGGIWNDGSEPIRGFVAAEFIDDKDRVYYRDREIAFIPKADQYTGISADWWIPPGKNAIFIYHLPDEMLKQNDINVKLEFFNLGDEFPALYINAAPSHYKSILETISVKVTSQTYKVQKDKVNTDAEQ